MYSTAWELGCVLVLPQTKTINSTLYKILYKDLKKKSICLRCNVQRLLLYYSKHLLLIVQIVTLNINWCHFRPGLPQRGHACVCVRVGGVPLTLPVFPQGASQVKFRGGVLAGQPEQRPELLRTCSSVALFVSTLSCLCLFCLLPHIAAPLL